ncbi:hypothetical protein [Aliamphritea spongicola]|nr:hypothetical protein [Aliamphritea spongicola]
MQQGIEGFHPAFEVGGNGEVFKKRVMLGRFLKQNGGGSGVFLGEITPTTAPSTGITSIGSMIR